MESQACTQGLPRLVPALPRLVRQAQVHAGRPTPTRGGGLPRLVRFDPDYPGHPGGLTPTYPGRSAR